MWTIAELIPSQKSTSEKPIKDNPKIKKDQTWKEAKERGR